MCEQASFDVRHWQLLNYQKKDCLRSEEHQTLIRFEEENVEDLKQTFVLKTWREEKKLQSINSESIRAVYNEKFVAAHP